MWRPMGAAWRLQGEVFSYCKSEANFPPFKFADRDDIPEREPIFSEFLRLEPVLTQLIDEVFARHDYDTGVGPVAMLMNFMLLCMWIGVSIAA